MGDQTVGFLGDGELEEEVSQAQVTGLAVSNTTARRHVNIVLVIIFDHQIMGREPLSFSYLENWQRYDKYRFLHNGILICIEMARETFCQLFNIANRFLRIFSSITPAIKN